MYNRTHIQHQQHKPKRKPLSPKINLTQSQSLEPETTISAGRKVKNPKALVNETYQQPATFVNSTYDEADHEPIRGSKSHLRSDSQTQIFTKPEHIKSLHSDDRGPLNYKVQVAARAYKKDGLTECQDEIKDNIAKMLRLNGYPSLSLRRNHKNEYVVGVEELALVIASVISDVDKKNKRIADLEKADNKMVAELEAKLKVSEKEVSLRSVQLKELQSRCNHALEKVKEFDQVKTGSYNVIKSFTSALPSPTVSSARHSMENSTLDEVSIYLTQTILIDTKIAESEVRERINSICQEDGRGS